MDSAICYENLREIWRIKEALQSSTQILLPRKTEQFTSVWTLLWEER